MKPSWMKFHFDFFDDARVKVIESMPDADTLIVIWFQLLAFIGTENTAGKLVLRGRDETPCTDELLASIIRRPLPTMRLALSTFVQMGMLQSIDGILIVTDWNRYVDEERLHRFDRKEKPSSEAKAQIVLAYAAAHPDASQVKIAKETGVPRSSVQRYLKSLPALPKAPAHLPCPNGVPTLPSGLPTGTPAGTPVGIPEPVENTGIREGAQTKDIDKDIEIDKDTSSSTAGEDETLPRILLPSRLDHEKRPTRGRLEAHGEDLGETRAPGARAATIGAIHSARADGGGNHGTQQSRTRHRAGHAENGSLLAPEPPQRAFGIRSMGLA